MVSVHANLDDTYEGVPGYDLRLVARGPNGQPVMWFFNSMVDKPCYATNHTLGLELGAVQEWIDSLIKLTRSTSGDLMLPLRRLSITCTLGLDFAPREGRSLGSCPLLGKGRYCNV